MWLDVAVLFVRSLSMISAHPSKENALGSRISKRDELASALGQVDVSPPGDFSGFNDGAVTSNYLPVNNALASSGAISSPFDQPLGDIFQIDERPTVPVDQALGGNFGLDVVGFLNKPSGDTTPQNKGNVPEEQISDDQQASANDAAYTPLEPCDPHQQSARLRPRGWCSTTDTNSHKDSPRVETSPSPPSVQPEPAASSDYSDSECVSYSINLFWLGVCSSSKPNMVFSSNLNSAGISSPVVRLLDADLGKLYFWLVINKNREFFFTLLENFLHEKVNNSFQLQISHVLNHHQAKSTAAISTFLRSELLKYVCH